MYTQDLCLWSAIYIIFLVATQKILYTSCDMKVMLPFFVRKCNCSNSEICMDDSYIFCNYEAIFPQSLYHFHNTFANIE
jgi:hypothetical protein